MGAGTAWPFCPRPRGGDTRQCPGSPSRRCGGTGPGPGAAGRPRQRSFRRGAQHINTPLPWDLVPALTLCPLLFPNFSSSNFTCKTFQAVTKEYLTYFTDPKQCLSLQPPRSKVPCDGQPGAAEPLLCSGEREMAPGSGAGERGRERARSHSAHLQAAAGRLSGHFFRNANHAVPYHIKPLIADDAARAGGERRPRPGPARGSAPGTV